MEPIKPRARLENWYVGDCDELHGEVFGHPRFPDGSHVKTSRVVTWDKVNYRAMTRNTEYELGKPLKQMEGYSSANIENIRGHQQEK